MTTTRHNINNCSSTHFIHQMATLQDVNVINGDKIKGKPYHNILFMANLESLRSRRIKLSQSFRKLFSSNSCLHTLLPPECNNEVLSKLRNPLKYPVPYSRTKRHQSSLNYALAHYQNSSE